MLESKKRKTINILFDSLYKKPPEKIIEFNNTSLKQVTSDTKFMNQFDAVKFDSISILPERLKEKGYFIVHLGKGRHAFVKGNGYHNFEKINKIKNIEVESGIIDNISDSEAGSVSFIYNERIIHDFLKEKKIKVHTARRSKVSFDFVVNDSKLHTDKQQIEIDGIFECDKMIAAVEAKNKESEDFEIRQLFSIKKYFDMLKSQNKMPKNTKVRILFLVRIRNKKKNICRLYEYKFTDDMDINSIKFVNAIEYQILTKEGTLRKFY